MMRADVTERWAVLNLGDPDARTGLAEQPTTADLALYGLCAPGAIDPVQGLVEGVRVDLLALTELLGESEVAKMIGGLARRLEVAMHFLARTDGREKMPPEEPIEDEPPAATEQPSVGEQPSAGEQPTKQLASLTQSPEEPS